MTVIQNTSQLVSFLGRQSPFTIRIAKNRIPLMRTGFLHNETPRVDDLQSPILSPVRTGEDECIVLGIAVPAKDSGVIVNRDRVNNGTGGSRLGLSPADQMPRTGAAFTALRRQRMVRIVNQCVNRTAPGPLAKVGQHEPGVAATGSNPLGAVRRELKKSIAVVEEPVPRRSHGLVGLDVIHNKQRVSATKHPESCEVFQGRTIQFTRLRPDNRDFPLASNQQAATAKIDWGAAA